MVRSLSESRASGWEQSAIRTNRVQTNTLREAANRPGPALGNSLLSYLVIRCGTEKTEELNQDFNTSASVLPRRAGEGETLIPADSMAAILDSASPLPPAMIAPAWPIRRPGGAVRPAMKPTIGFLRPRLASSLRNWAASSSDEPPISPIMTIDLVA